MPQVEKTNTNKYNSDDLSAGGQISLSCHNEVIKLTH